ncbi:MAG: hypothetical protein HKO66_15180 [Saprospiraceae bacterium]|nr:hypothetical protein [Bacteroidia bacterium]NNL93583.1 hypothetical protein [Saprospiraceae bacterium]
MKHIVKLIGVFIILIGLTIIIKPDFIFNAIEDNKESKGLYFLAIGFRFILGVIFIKVAEDSKFSTIIKFIGYLAILAALVFVFIGHASFQDLISSLSNNFKPQAPIIGVVGILFGGFLIYAIQEKKVK